MRISLVECWRPRRDLNRVIAVKEGFIEIPVS